MNIIGTSGADTLNGTGQADTVFGLAGDDDLDGRGGDDSILGGDGKDTLFDSGDGDDTLVGGAGDDAIQNRSGDDRLEGGSGVDRVSHTSDGVGVGVTVSLLIDGPQVTGHGTDTYIGIEHLSGTSKADVLIGDRAGNYLDGAGGNDSLVGNGGDDLLTIGKGDSTLDGGSGTDTVGDPNFGVFSTVGYTLSLSLQGAPQNSGRGMLTLTGIENLTGSYRADDLSGDDRANVLAGERGSDTLTGAGGDDLLLGDGKITSLINGNNPAAPIQTILVFTNFGFGSADVLKGGDGADTLVGGSLQDRLHLGQDADADVLLYTETGGSSARPGVRDIVRGFVAGVDKVDLTALGIVDFADRVSFTTVGNATIVAIDRDGDGDSNGYNDFALKFFGTVPTAADFIV